jgi:autotransporter-associated beta strand protein
MSMGDESGFSLNNEIAALTKVGLGTVRLTGRAGTGAGNDIDGGAYVLGGTLLLDYSTVTNVKIQTAEGAQFTTAGGDLRLIKTTASGTGITERMSGTLTVRAGGSEISIDAVTGSTLTLNLANNAGAAINRSNGGTLNFVESGGGTKSIVVGLAANRNTRLGSYATYGTENNKANAWAFINGSNDVMAYAHDPGEVNSFGAGKNTDLTANQTLSGPTTTNSIRFNATAVTSLDLGGALLSVTNGGLLIGSDHTGPLSISNGSMTTGGANDLIIHNYGTGGLTISADITGPTQSVTYAGTGVTTLVGAKTYVGTTYLVGGTVSIAADNSLGDVNNILHMNGGELQTTASVTIDRGITIGGDAAQFETVGAGNTTTLSGKIVSEGNFIYTEANTSVLTGGVPTVVNATNTDTVGVGDIIKTGAGTLLITGGANTFSGVVDVREGTLKVDIADVAITTSTYQLNFGTNESWLDGTIVRSGATLAFNKIGNANIAGIAEWFRMEDNTTIKVTTTQSGGRFSTSGLMEVQARKWWLHVWGWGYHQDRWGHLHPPGEQYVVHRLHHGAEWHPGSSWPGAGHRV